MLEKPSILVLGDPGPVRHELLLRSEVETFWTTRTEEVAAVLRHGRPEVCLVSPDLPHEQLDGAMELIAAGGATACIVLLGPAGGLVDAQTVARACAIIPQHRTDSILALVGLHTGLAFARDTRAKVEALVRAYIGTEEYVLETSNISVSGVAIPGFPDVPIGTMVHIEVELSGATVVAEARVIRYDREAGVPTAGLSFVRIARAQRERIMRLVESIRRESERPDVKVEDLFGDLTADLGRADALETNDLVPVQEEPTDDLDVHLELDALAAWLESDGWPVDIPEWLVRLGHELTPIERTALVKDTGVRPGRPAPAWVLPALGMRLCLARCRSSGEGQGGKLPSVVADEAYRMFVRLAEETTGEPDDVVAQVAKIRAALLRDLLAGGPRPRTGIGAPPEPREGVRPESASPVSRVAPARATLAAS